jgi:precorrin-6Y C5,15-methyltransferase (decarboxylating)
MTNCTARPWLSIIGIGEDGVDGLSSAARAILNGASLVMGGERHLALAAPLLKGEAVAWPKPFATAYCEIAKRRGYPTVILASGDPFHHGIGSRLAQMFGREELICISQPSAFSLAASRMGWALEETAQVSLHGRALPRLARYLQPGAKILALSWDAMTPNAVAQMLCGRGLGGTVMTVLEALGGPRERVRDARAETIELHDVDPLNLIALSVAVAPGAAIPGLASGLDDGCFEHDGQLTKREIRAVTLSALAPRQGELLWDVGLGAGSIAIEWLLCHPSMKAVGIESRADRAERAARNAVALGVPELEVVTGQAPQALAGLERPHAVFIGGGLSDPGVFETSWNALESGGRLVCNAVTLESEARLQELFGRHGGELTRLQVARAAPVGAMTGWHPAMPVTQWRVFKP